MTVRTVTEIARDMGDTLHASTEVDTLTRVRTRMALIFAGVYDDEPSEPDQAIRDLLTDVIHEARARGVDMDEAYERALWMQREEQAEWAERDKEQSA